MSGATRLTLLDILERGRDLAGILAITEGPKRPGTIGRGGQISWSWDQPFQHGFVRRLSSICLVETWTDRF